MRLGEKIMRSIVGIFPSRALADQALSQLLGAGIPQNSIIFMSGETGESNLGIVPTTDAESDGMGNALGAVVGGTVGAGAGMGLGAAVASMLVPGVGPIFAIGVGAGALLGLGGAVAGGVVGGESEKDLDTGVPKDDILLFRELLKRGRSVIVANTDSDETAKLMHAIMKRHSGQEVAEAREEIGRVF
jgi:hypothetical protein